MYRALVTLSLAKGRIIRKGSLFTGDLLAPGNLEKLIELGKVSKVSAPPLSALSGWQEHADKLEKLGVKTVEEFVRLDYKKAARALGIAQYKAKELQGEALKLLEAPDEGCGCN